ncbi:unnamed protein product [Adineta steineri]|uniref:F-box domain-containing protein n=1 Tax=Adineta steineri TaxID=433720 RepID=A0A819ACJ8_9BILA|nr:unnamed protein product [Adineta steineri]CAF3779973.1 unnamed protein product [Adineta steineri]
MSETKRQQIDVEPCNIKKKKFEDAKAYIKRLSLTHLEDISNELMYEIFEFLDGYDMYEAFSNLNTRFNNLLIYSTLPIKINMSSMSKSTFQRYYTDIIMPNRYRIGSLRLSDPFTLDLIFKPPRIILKFLRLETLILNNIKSKYLGNIFKYLSLLPRLFSLVIAPADNVPNKTTFYRSIFSLPVLKYCKLSYEERVGSGPLLSAVNECSTIEHLVINSSFAYHQLDALFTYIPQLRRFCCYSLTGNGIKNIELFNVPATLTHVTLKMESLNFNQFETLIRNRFDQLQLLRITASNDRTYLDAKRWEKLILDSMPYLHVFDFEHTDVASCNHIVYTQCDRLFDQFNSSFWSQRGWFFAHQHSHAEMFPRTIFYSTRPYRRKYYTIYTSTDRYPCSCHQETIHDLVDHVHIKDTRSINNCLLLFPHATKLTLSDDHDYLIFAGLNCFIRLTQLTNLTIDWFDLYYDLLVELLRFVPNIRALKLHSFRSYKSYRGSIQQTESFQMAPNENKITSLIIYNNCSLKDITLLISLCPRLQQMVLNIPRDDLQSTVNLLLMETIENTRHLFSLCLLNVTPKLVKILKTMIDSKTLLNNYSIKLVYKKLYLWW